mgnify:CR=1 FL=1
MEQGDKVYFPTVVFRVEGVEPEVFEYEVIETDFVQDRCKLKRCGFAVADWGSHNVSWYNMEDFYTSRKTACNKAIEKADQEIRAMYREQIRDLQTEIENLKREKQEKLRDITCK